MVPHLHPVIRPLALACIVTALSGCAGSDNPVAQAMDGLMPPKPSEVARDAFNIHDADKRRNAVALLSASPFGGEPPYVRTYRLLIDDPDATVRAACAKALGLHGDVEDVPLLIRRLTDDAAFVRWEAAAALQKIHSPDAIDPLVAAATRDDDPDVRQAAAYALGQYATPGVFNTLISCLDDPEFSVVAAARQSLVTLTGQDFGSDGARWLTWSRSQDGSLFDGRKQYVWEPFQRPRTVLEKAQFWNRPRPVSPRVPTGMDAADENL